MTMEILPEPTSNKLCDSILQSGNPVKEIFLKLNPLDHSDEVLKLKNFKKDDYTSFHDLEKYEHVGLKVTCSQEGKRLQDDDKRLDLADDLKEAQHHMQIKYVFYTEFFEDQRCLHFSLCSGSAPEEQGQKKEFQFSLVGNAKLNDVDLHLEAEQSLCI
ncbi:hypothetical protein Tco_0115986 [Tanacetum coccineum]